jgi:hypothetical protein
MPEDLKFEGFDNDFKRSLLNYGFICRNEKSDQYLCFYKVKDNQYDYGFINDSDISDLMSLKGSITKEQKEGFLKFCGQTQQNFDKLPFLHKSYSLVQYFGYEEILGKSINPMSLIEAIRLIENE